MECTIAAHTFPASYFISHLGGNYGGGSGGGRSHHQLRNTRHAPDAPAFTHLPYGLIFQYCGGATRDSAPDFTAARTKEFYRHRCGV